jgi:hypothetical protein
VGEEGIASVGVGAEAWYMYLFSTILAVLIGNRVVGVAGNHLALMRSQNSLGLSVTNNLPANKQSLIDDYDSDCWVETACFADHSNITTTSKKEFGYSLHCCPHRITLFDGAHVRR